MKKIISTICLFLIFWQIPCFALNTDRKQPMLVEADWSQLDHKNGIGLYRGHVKLTQGSTIIIADQAMTYLNKQNQLEKAVAIGKQASYQTMPDNSQFLFVATADTIYYYPLQAQVQLMGHALATQGKDSFAGPIIYYDLVKQTVTSPPETSGHTTIILQPDQKLSS